MPKLPKTRLRKLYLILLVVVIVAALLLFSKYTYFKNNQLYFGQPVAIVNGVVLDETDYLVQERLSNGQRRFQQKSNPAIKPLSRQEVISELVKITKMEIQAKKLAMYPTTNQINKLKSEIAKSAGESAPLDVINKNYGWSSEDYQRNVLISVLKSNLENVIVLWREAESVSLRFDILPVANPDLNFYKPKAQEFLKTHEEAMKNNVAIQTIVDELKADPAVLQVFPNAIGFRELSENLTLRKIQRVTKANTLSQDQHILGLAVPTKAEIWCTDAACYLTRVLAGSKGSFASLDEWVKTL